MREQSELLGSVDHLVYACPDLLAGIARIEDLLGVRASPGGRHPGGGTQNALLSLGSSSYLEIIGPDPEEDEPAESRLFGIDALTSPRLATWAARDGDLESRADAARKEGIRLGPVKAGSRKSPDGSLLSWRYTSPAAVLCDGLVPFFIDWGATPHPAASAARGARLIALRAEHPDVPAVRHVLATLGLKLPVTAGPGPALIAELASPKGTVELR